MGVTATGLRRGILPLEGALVLMGGSGASGGQWVAAARATGSHAHSAGKILFSCICCKHMYMLVEPYLDVD